MKLTPTQEVFSKIKPDKVTFILSIDKGQKPSGLIAALFLKCSRNPEPIIAISIGKQSYTHKLIKESKEFVVAFASKDIEKHILLFGKQSGRDVDKFKESGIETLKATKVKTPLLKDAAINLECQLYKEIDVGTSTLFLGKVLASHINEDKKLLFNKSTVSGEYDFGEL